MGAQEVDCYKPYSFSLHFSRRNCHATGRWPAALFPGGRHEPRDIRRADHKPSDNAAIVRGDNQFAVDLYAQLDREQPGKNLFFSPTSISVALAMTAAGARGPTQAEMAKVLHLDADLAQAHAHYHQLLEQWNAAGQKRAYQLRVANRLWGQKGYPIRPEFLALTRQQYGAEMLLVDFAQAAAASREINQWVEQQTNGKIKDLIPPGSLDALTRLVLTNAVYFKGDWVQPFDKQNTQEEDFTVSAQAKVKVPLMHQQKRMGYAEEETFQALELPYAGGELSMVVLLPKKVDGLAGVGEGDHGRQARRADVEAARPRGQHLPAQVQAGDFLRAEPDAGGDGDEAGIFPGGRLLGHQQRGSLYISAVLHKAYVDVNEEGTEAAAATGVVMRAMAMRRRPSRFRCSAPITPSCS